MKLSASYKHVELPGALLFSPEEEAMRSNRAASGSLDLRAEPRVQLRKRPHTFEQRPS